MCTKFLIFTVGVILSGINSYGQVPVAPANGNADIDKNWSYSKVYDVNGNVVGEKKIFFGTKGELLQTQAKNYSYGHVLASQPINDAQGRPVVQTQSAPINSNDFAFKSNFVSGYNYSNFDDAKTNNPDPVTDGGVGTLGWYYGQNNTWEKYQDATPYPYNRTDFYKDGTEMVKRSAGIGATFKMGSGHESCSYITPANKELQYYTQVRDNYFTAAELGQMPLLADIKAIQSISKDANGKIGIAIQDKSGKTLMTARPGNDITASTQTSIAAMNYQIVLHSDNFDYGFHSLVMHANGADGVVILDNIQVYSGPLSGYSFPVNGGYLDVKIKANKGFTIDYKRGSFLLGPIRIFKGVQATSLGTDQESYYFSLINAAGTIVSVTPDATTGGTYELYDMLTEQLVPGFTGSAVLPQGNYKLVALRGKVNLTYTNGYTDVSYNFYNQLGQLLVSLAPEGVKRLLQNGFSAYPTKADLPFASFYNYNLKRLVINSKNADMKQTHYIYRKDGKLRFSQNANQLQEGAFTYANYDKWGRSIERGEFNPTVGDITFNSAAMNAILEDVSPSGGLPIDYVTKRKDWVKTLYDLPDNSHGLAGYIQNDIFLRNTVSVTEKGNSKTWYNYNEFDQITWIITWTSGLGYKTIDYSYDHLERLVKMVYQKAQVDAFVHHYEYDADQNLKKVYTNTDDNPVTAGANKLQAEYFYYLTGELKRVELANKLQGIDYTYTVQGLLKGINHSDKTKDPGNDAPGINGTQVDAFGMLLEYYDGDYTKSGNNISSMQPGGTAASTFFNGMLSGSSWYSKKPAIGGPPETPTMYMYRYSDKNEFSESYWGTPDFNTNTFVEQVGVNKETIGAYDANGNIKTLNRTGTFTDNFVYNYLNSATNSGSTTNYNTNKLHSITGYSSYEYDDLGQLVKEVPSATPSNTIFLKYNVTGTVAGVYKDLAHTLPIVTFEYNERGCRILKQNYVPGTNTVNISMFYVYDERSTLLGIYTQSGSGNPILLQEQPIYASHKIGTYYKQSDDYWYEMKDHLGSVRAVIRRDPSNNQLEILNYTDYYAYGMVLRSSGSSYRYQFQGEYSQKDDETGWNAFELRMYDSRIGRWMQYDPKSMGYSPYTGMGNDPINQVDPDGGNPIAWGRAKLFALWNSGTVRGVSNRKGESGYVVEYNPGGGKEANKADGGRLEEVVLGTKFFKDERWTAQIKTKATIGLQFGIKAGFIKAEVNALSYEMISYDTKEGFGKYGMFSPTYAYEGYRAESSFGAELKLPIKIKKIGEFDGTIGLKYKREWLESAGFNGSSEREGSSASTLRVGMGLSKSGPGWKNSDGLSNQFDQTSSFKTLWTEELNIEEDEAFHGIDVGGGIKFLIGIEINFKIGYYN